VTTPEHPDEAVPTDPTPSDADPTMPPQLPADAPQSLLDRLAQLEPEDDDDLFDGYDDDEEDEGEPVDAAAAPAAAEPEVTSYDDSAFAAVGDAPADPVPAEAAVAGDPDVHATDVLDPGAHATTVLDPAEVVPAPVAPPVDPMPAADPVPADLPAAEPAPVADDAGDGDDAGRSRRRRTRRRRPSLPVVALLLMTVLMAAATAFLWLQVNEKDRIEDARRGGLEASRDAARLLFSYDYRTLDQDFSTGRALTTGEFRSQYEKTTTKVVADVAKQYKAVVKANVVSAGVVRATPRTVVTVVYVNQVTTSTRVTGEKVDLSRVRMTLQRSGDRWLVTAVNAL
jgi:Mce-associated membrane protein